MKRRVVYHRLAGTLAVAALLGVATPALAQNALQSAIARAGGDFWADDTPHAILTASTAHRYQICNVGHDSH